MNFNSFYPLHRTQEDPNSWFGSVQVPNFYLCRQGEDLRRQKQGKELNDLCDEELIRLAM